MMFARLSLLASTFARHFETVLQQEIAKIDLAEYRRHTSVLVRRGVVAPPVIAFYKAMRFALLAKPAVNMSPVYKHRVHTVEVKQSIGDAEHILGSGDGARGFSLASIRSDRTVSGIERLKSAEAAQPVDDKAVYATAAENKIRL